MSKEAMKLALEALEGIWDDGLEGYPSSWHRNAITALREALAKQPAQRIWVGLTHDEYDAICDKHSTMSDFDFLEDIEAKLKEKNT